MNIDKRAKRLIIDIYKELHGPWDSMVFSEEMYNRIKEIVNSYEYNIKM